MFRNGNCHVPLRGLISSHSQDAQSHLKRTVRPPLSHVPTPPHPHPTLDGSDPSGGKASRQTPHLGGQAEFLALGRHSGAVERMMKLVRFSGFPSVTTDPAHHPGSPGNFLSLSSVSNEGTTPRKPEGSAERLWALDSGPSNSLNDISIIPRTLGSQGQRADSPLHCQGLG